MSCNVFLCRVQDAISFCAGAMADGGEVWGLLLMPVGGVLSLGTRLFDSVWSLKIKTKSRNLQLQGWESTNN